MRDWIRPLPSVSGRRQATPRWPNSPASTVTPGVSRRVPEIRPSMTGAVAVAMAYGAGGQSFLSCCEMASTRCEGTRSVRSDPPIVAADHATVSAGGFPLIVNATSTPEPLTSRAASPFAAPTIAAAAVPTMRSGERPSSRTTASISHVCFEPANTNGPDAPAETS